MLNHSLLIHLAVIVYGKSDCNIALTRAIYSTRATKLPTSNLNELQKNKKKSELRLKVRNQFNYNRSEKGLALFRAWHPLTAFDDHRDTLTATDTC